MFSYGWIEFFSVTITHVQHVLRRASPETPTLSWSVRHGRWGTISLTFTLDTMVGMLRRRYPLYSLSLANVICEMKAESYNNFCYRFCSDNDIMVISNHRNKVERENKLMYRTAVDKTINKPS